ncbi:hypothetical protein KAR91_77460 [Candidatus Pacearchaeota archaeon]|nr:hypothetical protein [Candidatus Pacearchaeota archaeon]
MKFLESKEISNEKGNVKVVFKPVTALNQAALLGYQVDMNLALEAKDTSWMIQAKMKAVFYALKEMISTLTISGEGYPPDVVADTADISDMETVEALNIVFDMVVGLLVQGETKKKSSSQRKSTKKE